LPDAVAVGDQQQILRHVPDAVALAGFLLDPFGQRRIQFGELARKLALFRFAFSKRALGFNLLGDIAMGADQTNRLAAFVALDGGFDGNPA
jgi:hypothetical protein